MGPKNMVFVQFKGQDLKPFQLAKNPVKCEIITKRKEARREKRGFGLAVNVMKGTCSGHTGRTVKYIKDKKCWVVKLDARNHSEVVVPLTDLVRFGKYTIEDSDLG